MIGNFGSGVGQYFVEMNVKVFAEDINAIIKKYPNAKVYTSHRFYEKGKNKVLDDYRRVSIKISYLF